MWTMAFGTKLKFSTQEFYPVAVIVILAALAERPRRTRRAAGTVQGVTDPDRAGERIGAGTADPTRARLSASTPRYADRPWQG